MDSVQKICRFCFNTYDEDLQRIQEKEIEMMQLLCITLDLNITDNPFICSVCQKKLEDCYNFKKQCMHTEDSISPYIVKNVKINLKEISNPITIKSEDGSEPNICRLCLQPADNDMMLNEEENEQFEQFFPEINLHVTNFVILCTKCYGLLQKLFLFVSSCLEWEEKLHSFSEGDKVSLENFLHYLKYQNTTKDEDMDIIEEKIKVKEEAEEDMDEKNEEIDEKFMINSEVDIKDEDNDEASPHIQGQNPNIIICSDKEPAENSTVEPEFHCPHCDYKYSHKRNLRKHMKQNHIDPDKIKLYTCEHCDRKFTEKHNLSRHIEYIHLDPALAYKFKCRQCPFETRYVLHLEDHTKIMHGDPSTIVFYECQYCKFRTKRQKGLSRHIKNMHMDPSEMKMYKCEHCDHLFKFKANLGKHVQRRHSNPTEKAVFKCENCDFQTPYKSTLRYHMLNKCNMCDFTTNCKNSLKTHMLLHADSAKMLKCKECNFESISKKYFSTHMKEVHSELKMHKCQICGYESKHKYRITRHTPMCAFRSQYVGVVETESRSTMFQCKLCDCLFNEGKFVTKHIKTVHSEACV